LSDESLVDVKMRCDYSEIWLLDFFRYIYQMALTPIVKVVDLYVFLFQFNWRENSFVLWYRYRHEFLDGGFGVQWMDDNDENNPTNSKHSLISVRSVYNNHNTHLPAHIWRSLSKVLYIYIPWLTIDFC
jgi:hypothetical protein